MAKFEVDIREVPEKSGPGCGTMIVIAIIVLWILGHMK